MPLTGRYKAGGVCQAVIGGQYLAGGGRHVVYGVWQEADGICWPKSLHRSIS